MDSLLKELDNLTKYVKHNTKELKQENKQTRGGWAGEQRRGFSESSPQRRGGEKAAKTNKLDVTEDLLNIFVRFDIQRRFFNIVSMEILAQQFGLKEPLSLK